jgi:hypothetical protein
VQGCRNVFTKCFGLERGTYLFRFVYKRVAGKGERFFTLGTPHCDLPHI